MLLKGAVMSYESILKFTVSFFLFNRWVNFTPLEPKVRKPLLFNKIISFHIIMKKYIYIYMHSQSDRQ